MWVVYSLLAVVGGLLLLLLLVPVYGRIAYDGELRVRIWVLGIPVTLLPAHEPGRPPGPKERKPGRKPATAVKKPSQLQELKDLLRQDDVAATLRFLQQLAALAVRAAGKALRAVTVDRLWLELLLASDDPADTAQLYGKVCGVLYPAVAVIQRVVRIRRRELRVEPNFLLDQSDIRFDVRLHVSVWRLLGAGVYLLLRFIFIKEETTSNTTKEAV